MPRKKKQPKCEYCNAPADRAVGDIQVCPFHVRKAEQELELYKEG